MVLRDHPGGILVVDKPSEMTSARLVAIVKRLSKAKKVGHAGTLDPFATGVLVCCINKATRLADFLLKGPKKYEAVLYLGVSTDTQDKSGKIVSTCEDVDFSFKTIETTMKGFEGESKQHPPVFSALKHKGTPLYKLARAGKPVQKPARKINISYINIIEVCLPEIRFEISCSSGTYVRTLCADIGKALGCGGHLKELRRIFSSGFSIKEALTLSEIKSLTDSDHIKNRVISMRDALKDIPECQVTSALVEKIRNGVPIHRTDIYPGDRKEGMVKIIDKNMQLVAVLKLVGALPHYQYCCVVAP